MFGIGSPEILVILVILIIVSIPVFFISRILDKAGFSGWYSLLSLIPLLNVVCLWIFSLIDWPIEKKDT